MSKISNPKVEVPTSCELNEKDYCTCLLSTLKEMSKGYSLAMTEASNDYLYQIYRDIFLDISALQRKVYNLMFQNGWYILESVTQTKLDEKCKMLGNEYDGLTCDTSNEEENA